MHPTTPAAPGTVSAAVERDIDRVRAVLRDRRRPALRGRRAPDTFDATWSTPNVPRIRELLEWATAQAALPDDERRWWQDDWFAPRPAAGEWDCGSRCCIAGKTVLDDGWLPYRCAPADARPGEYVSYVIDPDSGTVRTVSDVAVDILGLRATAHPCGHLLFTATNTLRDLWTLAAWVTDGAITVPDGPFPDDYPPEVPGSPC